MVIIYRRVLVSIHGRVLVSIYRRVLVIIYGRNGGIPIPLMSKPSLEYNMLLFKEAFAHVRKSIGEHIWNSVG